MPLEVAEPELTAFRYNPAVRELMVAVGHPFYFSQRSQQFELDTNPFGDPHLATMKHVVFSHDCSELTFDAKIRRKQRHFVITAANEHKKILLETFAQLNANGFTTRDDEVDHVQLRFQDGRLTSLQIYKSAKDCELLDSLRIVGETDGYSLIKQAPWRKFKLNSVTVDDNRLISRSADEEFVFRLDVQPVIVEIVKRLVDSGVAPA
jgi:hypothetical protein